MYNHFSLYMFHMKYYIAQNVSELNIQKKIMNGQPGP